MKRKLSKHPSNHIQHLYNALASNGRMTQREYLSHVPESTDRITALREVYALETQRLVLIDYTASVPVYYLNDYQNETIH